MTAAHWLVPPPPSPMGSRPLPGVPAVGHTLDPRHCPACGTAAPATAREVKVPAPAPTPRVVPPPPPPAPPRPARKPQAPRCDTIVAADDVREGLRTLTQRFGRRVAAQVVGVSQDSVRRVIDGERVQIDVVETVRDVMATHVGVIRSGEGLATALTQIDALAKGDADAVMALMHHHLDSVASRALVAQTRPRGRDIMDILAPYAEPPRAARAKAAG